MTEPGGWATPAVGTPENTSQQEQPAPAPPPEREPGREIPLRPLGLSEVLDAATWYIRYSPRAALGLSAILTATVQIVVTVVTYAIARSRGTVTYGSLDRVAGPALATSAAGLLLTAYVVLLLAGLLAPVVGRTVLGRSTSLRDTWRRARPSLARLLGVSFLVLLITMVAALLPIAPFVAVVEADGPAGLVVLFGIVGFPLSLVLMVASYVWLAFAPTILVLERRGVFASMRRSAELVRGRWWRMFGGLLLTLLITVFVGSLILPLSIIVAGGFVIWFITPFHPSANTWTVLVLQTAARIVAGTLTNPFNAGVIALLYADRRMRREGFDIELQMSDNETPDDQSDTVWLPGPLTAAGSGRQPKVPGRAPLVRRP